MLRTKMTEYKNWSVEDCQRAMCSSSNWVGFGFIGIVEEGAV